MVICLKEYKKVKERTTFIGKIFSTIKLIFSKFKREGLESWVDWIDIPGYCGFYLIKLPYEIFEIHELQKSKGKKLENKILRFCREKGIDNCIIPLLLQDIFECTGIYKTSFKGYYIYRAVLMDIINGIYSLKHIDISDLDVVIIHGGDKEQLLRTINRLSGYIKYLTVLTEDKELIENEVNDIYEDTGLAVGITSDCKNTLRNADLIINYGRLDTDSNVCFNQNKIVINYGECDIKELEGDNIILYGVVIDLPEFILQKLDRKVFEFFSKTEITEILIGYKTGLLGVLQNDKPNGSDCQGFMESGFKNGGYGISGFITCKGCINIEDINQ